MLTQIVQEWRMSVEESSKCRLYKNIKTEFKLEPYCEAQYGNILLNLDVVIIS